jgi:hypothetical protein
MPSERAEADCQLAIPDHLPAGLHNEIDIVAFGGKSMSTAFLAGVVLLLPLLRLPHCLADFCGRRGLLLLIPFPSLGKNVRCSRSHFGHRDQAPSAVVSVPLQGDADV